MTNKLFAVAGVSRINGVLTTRVAKDMNRTKVLDKNGFTDTRLVELPSQMVKLDAMNFLLTHADFQDTEAQATITARIGKLTPKAPKVATETVAETAPVTAAEAVAEVVADEANTAAPAVTKTAYKRPSRSKAAIAERAAAKAAKEAASA